MAFKWSILDRMTDVLRELNFNYANLEKDLNRYLARLNFDQLEEVTNFHASSQVRSLSNELEPRPYC